MCPINFYSVQTKIILQDDSQKVGHQFHNFVSLNSSNIKIFSKHLFLAHSLSVTFAEKVKGIVSI